MVATAQKIKSVDVAPIEREITELPNDDFKWCTVSLSDVITAGKRLEASVFDIETQCALQAVFDCRYPKQKLLGEDGFVLVAFYGNRLKRNYVSSTNKKAIGFIGSAEMLDIKPHPIKFMNSSEDKTNALRVEEGTILVSRSGTIGNLTFVNRTLSKFLVSEHAIRLKCHDYPGYVYSFLKTKIGQSIIRSKVFGSVILEVEPEHLADIPVPNPPAEIKKRINDLILRSFELRDQSNELIDKATKMLISALDLPPIDEIQTKRFDDSADVNNFSVKLSNIDCRIDASYHIPLAEAITELLKQNAAEVTTVGDSRVTKDIILAGVFKRIYVEEAHGIPFLGGKEINQLCPKTEKYLARIHHESRYNKELKVSENMILVTDRGTIGTAAMVPKHWNGWAVSQNVPKVIAAEDALAGYLYVFLNSDYGALLVRKQTYGSVVDMIDHNSLSSVPFPFLKDKDIQNEINRLALEANKLRYEAYLLEQQAIKSIEGDVIYA